MDKLAKDEVISDPTIGSPNAKGYENKDPNFLPEDGFEKRYYNRKFTNGEWVHVHYQYNKYTGKAYDVKYKFE